MSHGYQDLLGRAQSALDSLTKKREEEIELVFRKEDYALTRFANSIIHQNVRESTELIDIRMQKDNQRAVVTVSSEDQILKGAETCVEMLRATEKNPNIPQFSSHSSFTQPSAKWQLMNVEERVDMVAEAIDAAKGVDKEARLAGSCAASDYTFAFTNTNSGSGGTKICYSFLIVNSLTEKNGNKGFGREYCYTHDPKEIKATEIATKATKTAVLTCDAITVDPGSYMAVLGENPVRTVAMFTCMIGLSADNFNQGRSFLTDKIGESVFSEKITILDDPFDETTIFKVPMDDEGTKKRQIELISNGVPKNVLYDRFTAKKYLGNEEESTGHRGHALPSSGWRPNFPFPQNLKMNPGTTKDIEEMIQETKSGLLVKGFHYTNTVNPKLGVITGLTRDGVFQIRDGSITKAVKNFRFTDGLIQILGNVDMVGQTLKTAFNGAVPPMRVESLRFSGGARH